MKLPFLAILVFFAGAVLKTDASEKKASFGLLKIFNHFIDVTDLVGQVPTVLQKIAHDIVDDIRRLIPHVENTMSKNNLTEPILKEIANAFNMTRVTDEYLPELEEILEKENITNLIDEIIGYLNISRVEHELLPELDKIIDEYNITKILDDIKALLNVTFIANELLPEIERGLEGENVTKMIEEAHEIFDMVDISGKVIPSLEKILESHNVSQIVHALDDLLNLTRLAEEILPGLGRLFEELEINDTLQEVRKFLNMTNVHGLLDELDKLIVESNITHHVPDLEPFLNVSIIRSKLTEVEKLLDHFEVEEILDEIEKHLDVDHLISRVPDLDEFLEDLGLSQLLQDINALIEMSFLSDSVEDIKAFLLSANVTDKIDDLEKLFNVSYLRDVIVPEIDRMVKESNISTWYDDARQFLNTTYLKLYVIPEVEKIWDDLNMDEQIEMLVMFTNMTYLREFVKGLDQEWNITLKGKQIGDGDLPGVFNGILDDLFKSDGNQPIDVPSSTPKRETRPTEIPASTAEPTAPEVCDNDCNGDPCGDAYMNSCEKCVMGKTGRDANHGMDCNNECGGSARNDSCGYCSRPTKDGRLSAFADCNDDCDGTAVNDSCGNCAGGKTGKRIDYAKDACGVCGGDNSTCKGCDGVPNSGKVKDFCKVCGGDGSSCTTISVVHPSLLPTTSSTGRTVTVFGAGLKGDAIKCFLDNDESTGTVINNTHCRCTIPSGKTAGNHSFTVKVRKGNNDIETDDLVITLYDSSKTKITSLTPAEALTDEETTFTFGGSELVNSPTAVCVATVGNVKRSVRASFTGGRYMCTFPAQKKSMSVSLGLSLNGVHELSSDVPLTRNVYAKAPTATRAGFIASGALVAIEFDHPISTTSLSTCAAIFSGLTSLGTSPTCKWTGRRYLIISPGVDATIVPNDSLTFKSGAVKRDETYAKALSGSVTIDGPRDPVRPVPVIVGPKQISSCGHLILDGRQSSGGGGRNLKYEWSLTTPVNAEISAVLTAAKNKSKAFINGTLMQSGTTYTFKLTVKNYLNSTGVSITIQVLKVADPSPEVTVDGPREGTVFGRNSFHLAARAKAASCSSNKALTFAWSVKCTKGDSADAAKAWVEYSAGYKATSKKFALKIDAGALLAGRTYEFTVVVASKANPSIKTTVKTSVVVAWSPLEPSIVGGDRTIGRDSGKLKLDAKSSTVDPDNADGDLHCTWSCYDKATDQPCYSAVSKRQKTDLPNKCVLEVDSVHFHADKTYRITSQVSKGSRSAESSILLTVVAGKPPEVTILTPNLRVVATKRVPLKATYKSSIEPVKVEWESIEQEEYRYINLSDSSLFVRSFEKYKAGGRSISVKVLKPDVLTPGASYMFRLNVHDGTSVGSSTMIVTVRNGITSGGLEVSTTTLEELQDVTLRAPHWVTDSDAYPIKYEFGNLNKKGRFRSWTTQTTNEYTIAVPPGTKNNVLTLRVKATDMFGSMMYADKDITVTELSSIDESKVDNLMKETLKDADDTGDFSKAVPKMKNILKAVTGKSGVSATLAKKVTSTTVTSLLLAVKSTSLDKEQAAPILNTFLDVQADYIDKADDILDGLQQVIVASVKSLDKETVEETLGWLGGVSKKANQTDAGVSEDIVNTYDALAGGLLNDVNLGETVSVKSPANPNVEMKVAHSLLDKAVPADDSSSATEVDFGSELSGKCGERECSAGFMCIGCQSKVITYKEDYFNDQSSDKPDIVSDKIVSVSINNPETGDEQKITNLTNPFNLTFQTGKPSSGKTLRCYYYNKITAQWSSDGITSLVVGEQLQCLSSHLTSFSPAEVKENGTQTAKEEDKDDDDIALIIGIVVGVSAVVVIIALLVAYLLYRNKQESKVRSVSPPYQTYDNKAATSDHEMTPV